MLVLELFKWWYGDGWLRLASFFGYSIAGVWEAFSVGLLLQTLFAPFRQISVGTGSGRNLDSALHDWADLQVSRLVGAMVRLAVITVGLVMALVSAVAGIVGLIVWPLLPVAPVVTALIMLGAVR